MPQKPAARTKSNLTKDLTGGADKKNERRKTNSEGHPSMLRETIRFGERPKGNRTGNNKTRLKAHTAVFGEERGGERIAGRGEP